MPMTQANPLQIKKVIPAADVKLSIAPLCSPAKRPLAPTKPIDCKNANTPPFTGPIKVSPKIYWISVNIPIIWPTIKFPILIQKD